MTALENGLWKLLEYHRTTTHLTLLQHISIATLAAWKAHGHTLSDGITKQNLCDEFDHRIIIIANDDNLIYNLNQCLSSYSELINELSEIWKNCSLEKFMPLIVNKKLQEYDKHDATFSTPDSILSIVEKLQNISKEDTCICYGSGYGAYTITMATKCKQSIGVDINSEAIEVSKLLSYWSNTAPKFINKNLLNCTNEDFHVEDNAKIFVDMPWSLSVKMIINELLANPITEPYYMNSKGTGKADWSFVLHALGIAPKGRIVAIMAGHPLFSTGTADLKIRRSLLNRKVIEGIIALPDMLYFTTSIPINLVIFSTNNTEIKMFNASMFGNKEKRRRILSDTDILQIITDYKNCTGNCISVSSKTIEENNYNLNPMRYDTINDYYNDNTIATIYLKNITNSIQYGSNIKIADLDSSVSSTPTKQRYLTVQHLSDYGIFNELPYLNISLDNRSKKALISNENLILFKQAPFRSGIVYANDDEQVIAKGNLYILDIDKSRINPIYLLLYLRSEKGLNQLNSYAQGAVIKIITLKDLERIEIPLIPMKEQNRIAEKYIEYTNTLHNIEKKKKELLNNIDSLL